MKIANIGSDYVELNETNIHNYTHIEKVHLIKFTFKEPSYELVKEVLETYKSTNRFVIGDNIKFYNDILRTTNKKYYVENYPSVGLISFFRKNNKVLLNFEKLPTHSKEFIFNNLFEDILKNVEVILLKESDFNIKKDVLLHWRGNVILKKQ